MTKQNNQRPKISRYGITVGQQSEDKDIKILGLTDETLKLANSYFPHVPEESALERAMPKNKPFLYKIEEFDKQRFPKRKLLRREIGVGEIFTKGKDSFLKRISLNEHYKEESGKIPLLGKRVPDFPQSSHLIITSYAPEAFPELFFMEDSVICSLGYGRPECVHLENGSVLGKTDGEIRSLDIQELFLANDKPIVTASSKFEMVGKNSIFISNSLLLKSTRSRPRNPQAGTIIYNSRKKAFEGFNGSEWKTLKWED